MSKVVAILNIKYFFCLFLISQNNSTAQTQPSAISPSHFEINNEKMEGMRTFLDFSEKEIYKGWWQYSRKFGFPKFMKTYYQVLVPESKNAREIILFSKVEKPFFYLGIPEKSIEKEEKEFILSNIEAVLLDFKRWMYRNYYQQILKQIESNRPQTQKWEEWIRFSEKRLTILNQLKEI